MSFSFSSQGQSLYQISLFFSSKSFILSGLTFNFLFNFSSTYIYIFIGV